MRHIIATTLVLGLSLCWVEQDCLAQKPKPSKTSSREVVKPDPKKQAEALRNFQGKLVTVFDPANPDSGDYISCEFTVQQLMQLRPKPEVIYLSSYDEEILKDRVIAEALSQSNAGTFEKGQEVGFVQALSKTKLEGLTPGEALVYVIF